MTDGITAARAFFYGLQPNWWTWDRLYRVYVSERMLAGAYVGGQIHDEGGAALQLQGLRGLFSPLVRRWLAQRQRREELYDSVDPFAPDFLDLDRRNFQIPRSDIRQVTFDRHRSLWMPDNLGSVEVEKLDGTKLRWILLAEQDPEMVCQLLQAFDAGLEQAGPPTAPGQMPALAPTVNRNLHLGLAVVFLLLGGVFGYVGLLGQAPDSFLLFIAAVGVVAAGWCLWQTWQAE